MGLFVHEVFARAVQTIKQTSALIKNDHFSLELFILTSISRSLCNDISLKLSLLFIFLKNESNTHFYCLLNFISYVILKLKLELFILQSQVHECCLIWTCFLKIIQPDVGFRTLCCNFYRLVITISRSQASHNITCLPQTQQLLIISFNSIFY